MAKTKDKKMDVASFAFEYRLMTRYNSGLVDSWKPCTEKQKLTLEKTSRKYEFKAKIAPQPTENMVLDEE